MEIGASSRPKVGEIVCGDQHLVIQNHVTVIAVADGLGHGPQAKEASVAALESIRQSHAEGLCSLEEIIRRCDRAIAHSRGAALTVLRIDPQTHELAYAGIGNVEMQSICRQPVRPPNLPGIVGVRIRRVNETKHPLFPGDLLAVYTDGISGRFQLDRHRQLASPQLMADAILAEHGKDHDDATCLVIRYG
jgi:hypothetical protein